MNTLNQINAERLSNLNRVFMRLNKSDLYKNKFRDINELKELSELEYLPVTTKEELRKYSPFGNMTADFKDVIEYHETSGTTGKSISTWLTKNDYEIWCKEMDNGVFKFNENDKVAIRYPYALSFPAHILQTVAKRSHAAVIPVDSRGVVTPHTRVINLLLDLKVTVIACMPLELIMLAETATQMGYNPKEDFKFLRAFYTAGELLVPERKTQIENIWGVPIYDHYGLTECGMIAANCENSHLHLADENFIVEILDPQTLKPVNEGEMGVITITNTTLEANPVIRYYTGDLGRKIISHNCSCGQESEILEHHGRIDDAVSLNNKVITMTQLQNILLREIKEIVTPFWIVIKNSKRLIFKVESDNASFDERTISERLTEKLGIECKIEKYIPGKLFNKKKLLQSHLSIKPQYIVDYIQNTNYYSTFDELIRGFGTF